jgi:hypothetical protein
VYSNKSNVPALTWRLGSYPDIPGRPNLAINDWTVEIETNLGDRSYLVYKDDKLVDVIGNHEFQQTNSLVYKLPKDLQNQNLCFKTMNLDRLESACQNVCHLGIVIDDFETCGYRIELLHK